MGFGILFFGYFVTFAFSLSEMYFFADIIGAVIMLYSFTRLAEYNRYYTRAALAACVFLVLCGVKAANLFFGFYETGGAAALIISVLNSVFALLTHIFVFLGARGIALGAGSLKLSGNAERNMIITIIYYAAYIIFSFADNSGELMAYINVVMMVYWIVCLVLNLVFIYKCYAILAPFDEDENAKTTSRFKLLNKLDDKMDEFEKNKQDYRMESVKMAREEADRLAEEKSRHRKQHRKKKNR